MIISSSVDQARIFMDVILETQVVFHTGTLLDKPGSIVCQKVHSNTSQSFDRPFRILRLISSIKTSKVRSQKRGISLFHDSFSSPTHQIKQVVNVMHTQKMSTSRLLGCRVMDIRSRDAQTTF